MEISEFLKEYYQLCNKYNMYLMADSVGNLNLISRESNTVLSKVVFCSTKSVGYWKLNSQDFIEVNVKSK